MSALQTSSAASSHEAAAEDRHAFEQTPLLLIEEVVAPFDRRAQRLLPGINPAAGLQQVEPLGEPVEKLIGREGGDASGGELKGKRKVVEPRADLFDDRAGFEPRISRARPGGEELRRILRLEGRDGIGLLAGQPQQLPARHEKPKLRAGGEQPREVVGRIDQVLEVVEDEQESTVGDSFGEAVPCLERLRSHLDHELRVTQRAQWSPEDAVGIVIGGFCGRLEREPGLARSGRAGQRQQTSVLAAEQNGHLIKLTLASEEGRGRNREVRLLQALWRRERLVTELVDPLRRSEILQTVFAEVPQAGGVDERCGRRGDQDLPSMSSRGDAGRSVNVLADIALLRDSRRPGVDPNAHLDRSGLEHLLRFAGSSDCSRRCGEGDEERVALRIHLDAVVADERLTKDTPVRGQRVCISIGTKLLEKPRRTFDVGEDKRDRSARKLARHTAIEARRTAGCRTLSQRSSAAALVDRRRASSRFALTGPGANQQIRSGRRSNGLVTNARP